jgi:hypothetical protein
MMTGKHLPHSTSPQGHQEDIWSIDLSEVIQHLDAFSQGKRALDHVKAYSMVTKKFTSKGESGLPARKDDTKTPKTKNGLVRRIVHVEGFHTFCVQCQHEYRTRVPAALKSNRVCHFLPPQMDAY